MKIGFFGSILILLLVTLTAKGVTMFARVQEHTKYAFTISSHSVLMDVAHAQAAATKHSVAPQENALPKDIKPANPPSPALKTNLPSLESDLSSGEIKLLKELSRRREELNRDQQDLQTREEVLNAAEKKLDKKMHDLKSLNAQVEEAMKIYEEKEAGKIKSLVKIYENMKPKDAAKIFDALEMPILLEIVSQMKEIKISPILASMHTAKASELSVALTRQKKLTIEKNNSE